MTGSRHARIWAQHLSEELLVRFCAPTLAGIKAASLFTCHYERKQELTRELIMLNRRLADKGLRIIPLRCEAGRCLIYMYRPEALLRCLSNRECREILRQEGYTGNSLGQDIGQLIHRFRTGEQFPHEIGIFLDYPVEDVKGFICHAGKCYKAAGYWKVYGDVAAACRLFQRYRKCTEIYCREAARGIGVERLAVCKKAAVS